MHVHRPNRRRPAVRVARAAAAIQPLEARQMMSADPTIGLADPVRFVGTTFVSSGTFADTPGEIAGYGPGDPAFGSTTPTGPGQTIAIIVAPGDPDTAAFDSTVGPANPAPFGQTGSTIRLAVTHASAGDAVGRDVDGIPPAAPAATVVFGGAFSPAAGDLPTATPVLADVTATAAPIPAAAAMAASGTDGRLASTAAEPTRTDNAAGRPAVAATADLTAGGAVIASPPVEAAAMTTTLAGGLRPPAAADGPATDAAGPTASSPPTAVPANVEGVSVPSAAAPAVSSAARSSAAVATSTGASHAVGPMAALAGAAVAFWVVTEPARDRRREQARTAAPPGQLRAMVAAGVFRG